MTGGPKESPALDLPPELEQEPKTSPGEKKKRAKTLSLATLISGGVGLTTLLTVSQVVRAEAKDAARSVNAELTVKVDALERVQKDDAGRYSAEQTAIREELRELYKASRYNVRSERLEKPPTPVDGGTHE